jgi:polysaccharide transporter, PST family
MGMGIMGVMGIKDNYTVNTKGKDDKKVFLNILSLGVIQLLRLGLPLLTFPYLTRVLGVEKFGILAFGLGIVAYVTLIVDFGFTQIATAKVATLQNEQSERDKYFSTVTVAKLILFISSSILLICILLIINDDERLNQVVVALLLIPFGSLMISTWFFIGLEKMKQLVPIDIIGRCITIPLIFIFVKTEADLALAAFFQSLSFLISGLIGITYLYKNKIVTGFYFDIDLVVKSLKEAKEVFYMSVASNLYTASIPVFLGIILGPIYVAYYKVADNVRGVAVGLLSPISNATYARVNSLVEVDKLRAKNIIIKFSKIAFILATMGNVIVFLFADYIVLILAGKEYGQSILILKLITIVVQIGVCNQYLGIQSLIPFGFKHQLSKIVIFSAIANLISVYPLILIFGLSGAVYSAILAEFLIFSLLMIFHRKRELGIFL